jgi:hypothetical protein
MSGNYYLFPSRIASLVASVSLALGPKRHVRTVCFDMSTLCEESDFKITFSFYARKVIVNKLMCQLQAHITQSRMKTIRRAAAADFSAQF